MAFASETKKREPAFADIGSKVSSSFGHLEESFQGTNGKRVIFIQDAHDSLEAQQNIARLVTHFVKEGTKTVFEEGYAGKVPTDLYFGKIQDKAAKRKVSFYYLDRLQLGGAEYAHINRNQDFELKGADDLQAYLENVRLFRDAEKSQAKILKDLNAIQRELKLLQKKIWSPQAQKWFSAWNETDSGHLRIDDYLRIWFGQLSFEEQSSFPRLADLFKAFTKGSEESLLRLKQARASEIAPEIESLHAALAKHAFDSDPAFQLYEITRMINRLEKLAELHLPENEYEALKKEIQNFKTEKLAAWISGNKKGPVVISKRWEKAIDSAMRFYETAKKRDAAAGNALKEWEKKSEGTAVLVFGGFHRAGITRALREQGFSYEVITPKISEISISHQKLYRESMLRGISSASIIPVHAARPPNLFLTLPANRAQFEIESLAQIALQNPTWNSRTFSSRARTSVAKARSEMRAERDLALEKEFGQAIPIAVDQFAPNGDVTKAIRALEAAKANLTKEKTPVRFLGFEKYESSSSPEDLPKAVEGVATLIAQTWSEAWKQYEPQLPGSPNTHYLFATFETKLKTIVFELLLNAIAHGNLGDTAKPIDVWWEKQGNEILIHMADDNTRGGIRRIIPDFSGQEKGWKFINAFIGRHESMLPENKKLTNSAGASVGAVYTVRIPARSETRLLQWLPEKEAHRLARSLVKALSETNQPPLPVQIVPNEISLNGTSYQLEKNLGQKMPFFWDYAGMPTSFTITRIGPLLILFLENSDATKIADEVTLIRQQISLKLPDVADFILPNLIITTEQSYQMNGGLGAYAQEMLLSMLGRADDFLGANVADFGAGNGILAQLALMLGAEHVWLLDYDFQQLEIAQQAFLNQGLDSKKFSVRHIDILHKDFEKSIRDILSSLDIALINIGAFYQGGLIHRKVIEAIIHISRLKKIFNGGMGYNDAVLDQYREDLKTLIGSSREAQFEDGELLFVASLSARSEERIESVSRTQYWTIFSGGLIVGIAMWILTRMAPQMTQDFWGIWGLKILFFTLGHWALMSSGKYLLDVRSNDAPSFEKAARFTLAHYFGISLAYFFVKQFAAWAGDSLGLPLLASSLIKITIDNIVAIFFLRSFLFLNQIWALRKTAAEASAWIAERFWDKYWIMVAVWFPLNFGIYSLRPIAESLGGNFSDFLLPITTAIINYLVWPWLAKYLNKDLTYREFLNDFLGRKKKRIFPEEKMWPLDSEMKGHLRVIRENLGAAKIYHKYPDLLEIAVAWKEFEMRFPETMKWFSRLSEGGIYVQTPFEWIDSLKQQFDLNSDKPVLEVGSGNGLAAFAFHIMTGAEVASVEIDAKRWHVLQTFLLFLKNEKGIYYPKVSFKKTDFLKFSLRKFSFIYFFYTRPKEYPNNFAEEVVRHVDRNLSPRAKFASPGFYFDDELKGSVFYPDHRAEKFRDTGLQHQQINLPSTGVVQNEEVLVLSRRSEVRTEPQTTDAPFNLQGMTRKALVQSAIIAERNDGVYIVDLKLIHNRAIVSDLISQVDRVEGKRKGTWGDSKSWEYRWQSQNVKQVLFEFDRNDRLVGALTGLASPFRGSLIMEDFATITNGPPKDGSFLLDSFLMRAQRVQQYREVRWAATAEGKPFYSAYFSSRIGNGVISSFTNVSYQFAVKLSPLRSESRIQRFNESAPISFFLKAFGIDSEEAYIRPFNGVWGRVNLGQNKILGLSEEVMQRETYKSLEAIMLHTNTPEAVRLAFKNGSSHGQYDAYLLTYAGIPAALVWPELGEKKEILYYPLLSASQERFFKTTGQKSTAPSTLDSSDAMIRWQLKNLHGVDSVQIYDVTKDGLGNSIHESLIHDTNSGFYFPTVFPPHELSSIKMRGKMKRLSDEGEFDLLNKVSADIGSGSGTLSVKLLENGSRKVRAVDVSLLKLMNTQAQVAAAFSGTKKARQNDLELFLNEIPSADFYFFNAPTYQEDGIVSGKNVNEYLPKAELRKIFSEAARRAYSRANFLFRIFISERSRSGFEEMLQESGWEIDSQQVVEPRIRLMEEGPDGDMKLAEISSMDVREIFFQLQTKARSENRDNKNEASAVEIPQSRIDELLNKKKKTASDWKEILSGIQATLKKKKTYKIKDIAAAPAAKGKLSRVKIISALNHFGINYEDVSIEKGARPQQENLDRVKGIVAKFLKQGVKPIMSLIAKKLKRSSSSVQRLGRANLEAVGVVMQDNEKVKMRVRGGRARKIAEIIQAKGAMGVEAIAAELTVSESSVRLLGRETLIELGLDIYQPTKREIHIREAIQALIPLNRGEVIFYEKVAVKLHELGTEKINSMALSAWNVRQRKRGFSSSEGWMERLALLENIMGWDFKKNGSNSWLNRGRMGKEKKC